jgi:hypothetical protein
MYLLDTNIWLERLLGQTHSEDVGQLLDTLPTEELVMTDFTLHSLGVILNRLGQRVVFVQFVQDVLIDGAVLLIGLSPMAMHWVVAVIEHHGLDFDDAYQYVVAEQEDAVIVSFDTDFDHTERGRRTPAQILAGP